MPKRVPLRLKLRFQIGTEDTRLHACKTRARIDREHFVEPREIDRENRARLGGGCLKRARDRRPPSERDHYRVRIHRRAQHGRHLLLAARAHDDVGESGKLAAALKDQIAQ